MITKINQALGVLSDRRGVTAMEYGLIAALIAVVVVGSVSALGANLSGAFSAVASATQ